MSLFDYFRALQPQKTAKVAKERLKIIVAHERRQRDSTSLDYLPLLQRELLEVVRKYVAIEDEQIKVHIEKEGDYEILELNITLPDAENRQINP
ncbi:MAG: cell division topological specificity factor MinE [Candidatus Parabeggiatoa sp. nov. 2]|nr:MAG: cell division topological specificity factor MinE [Beggiatoa sp. 4572_84]RKZ60024.1 MAG: cell division topological specificity factor MinE [Gammaproteobacteria bacterium]HEC83719.1 cell division topological specificity factor MinE [Thioploca sp.]